MGKIIQLKHSLDYYLHAFDVRFQGGDFLGALDAGRNAILYAKTRMDKQAINLLLSEAYFEMGLYALGCEFAFRAVKIPATRANAFLCIGKNLTKMGRFSLALKYFSKALEWGNTRELIDAVLEWGGYIREKMTQNHGNCDILAPIRLLVRQKRFDEALAQLQPNLACCDLNYQILYCDVLAQMGECDQARDILHKILKFDKENVGALLVLANICLIDADYISLDQNLLKLANFALSNREMEVVANIYSKCGNYQQAIKFYQKILKNDEFNTKILLFCAICYYNLGDTKEALYFIGQARWVDIENPVLNIFYEIINGNLEENLPISTAIPQKTGQEKLDFVCKTIEMQNFEGIFETSLTLAGDIEWCLMLKNDDFLSKITQKLSNSTSKTIISYYNKLLLTTRFNSRQKFYLAKDALIAGRLKSIDFTNSMYYHSFKLKIPQNVSSNQTLLRGYCGAVVYSEITNQNVNLDAINQKLNKIALKNTDFPITENLISCLYFCANSQILDQACIYFDTPKSEVEQAIKCLNLL